jgi:hypothetical protein
VFYVIESQFGPVPNAVKKALIAKGYACLYVLTNMQESDLEIVEKDATLLPGEARILRRMADLIKQRRLDSLFAFLQPTLVP